MSNMQEQITQLLADLRAAGVPMQESTRDTAPTWRIARQEVRGGSGWAISDNVLVFAGSPEAPAVIDDSKDAGWASAFNPSFRDGEREQARKGCHGQCRLFEFSARAAAAAGVTWAA